jgi:antiviral helicase SLH1
VNVIVIKSRKSGAQQMVSSLKRFKHARLHITTLNSNESPATLNVARIFVTTPDALLHHLSRPNLPERAKEPSLLICDDLENLDDAYELAISLILHTSPRHQLRILGLSASLNYPDDLADWLGVSPDDIYSFSPSSREDSLRTTSQALNVTHSSAFFKSAAKPAFSAIRSISHDQSTIVFVPSQNLCRGIAESLMKQSAVQMETRGFLSPEANLDTVEYLASRARDPFLSNAIAHGIGWVHGSMNTGDRRLVFQSLADGIIRIVILPREQCWATEIRASLVVVLGTQYLDFDVEAHPLRSYSLQEILRMQSLCVRRSETGTFLLICHAEDKDTFLRFLEAGIPVESHLPNSTILSLWLDNSIKAGVMHSKQDLLDFLGSTYLSRRARSNPTFYDLRGSDYGEDISRLTDRIWSRFSEALPPSNDPKEGPISI